MNQLASLIFAALLLAPLASLHAAEVTNLRCEYLKDPLGIDVARSKQEPINQLCVFHGGKLDVTGLRVFDGPGFVKALFRS